MSLYLANNGTRIDTEMLIYIEGNYTHIPVLISLIDYEIKNRKAVADIVSGSRILIGDYLDSTCRVELANWNIKYNYRSTKMGERTHTIVKSDRMKECYINWDGSDHIKGLCDFVQRKFYIPLTFEITKQLLELTINSPFRPLKVLSDNPNIKPIGWLVDEDVIRASLKEVVADLPETNFDWDSIESTEDYLSRFIGPISEKLNKNISVMLSNKIDDRMFEGKVKPFKGQIPVIQSGIEVLKREKFAYLACAMGFGKTVVASKIALCHLKGNFTALVVAPQITLSHWKKEIQSCFSYDVDVVIVRKTSEFIQHYASKKDVPTFYVVGKETFKLDAAKKPGVTFRPDKIKKDIKGPWGNVVEIVEEPVEVAHCPRCNAAIENINRKEKTFLLKADFKKNPTKSNYRCHNCSEVLWQSCYDKTRKSSLIRYIRTKNIIFDLVINDELHQSNNSKSLIGTATRCLTRQGKKFLLLSGTTNNGYASSFHNVLMGLKSGQLSADECIEPGDFIRKYGTLVGFGTAEELHKRHGKTVNESDFKEVEGVNPVLFVKYLSRNFIFATLEDLGEDLPPFTEKYIGLEPSAKLRYEESQLKAEFKEANRFRHKMYENTIVRHWVNNPNGWSGIPVKGQNESIIYPKNLPLGNAKEDKLLEIIQAEHAEGRKSVIYTDFTGEDSSLYMQGDNIASRLKARIEEKGIRVLWLKPSVKAIDRKDFIDANTDKYDVIICNPKLVEVGVNLQAFPTYIVYIPSYQVNLIDQAICRGYRANSEMENRIYHLYLTGTCEEDIIKRYQLKKVESKAIEANFNFEVQVSRTASSLGKRLDNILTGKTPCEV